MIAPLTLDTTLQQALAKLAHGPRPFFVDFKERCQFAQLVMMGLARCYVVKGGEQWVQLSEAVHQQMSATAENVRQETR